MALPDTPFLPSQESQELFLDHHRYISQKDKRLNSLREHMRRIDLSYLREEDLTLENWKARLAVEMGDSNKIQNVTVPIVKPQVNAAVDYQLSVFLTDYPIFGVVSGPQYAKEAMALQALIEENSVRMGWVAEFTKFFFDAFKYWGAIEACWDEVTTAAIETDITYKEGKEGRPREIVWSGNRITRWDPYNTYFDTRCNIHQVHTDGDYCGHTKLMTKTALRKFIAGLRTKIISNIKPAFESPSLMTGHHATPYASSYYIPPVNYSTYLDQGTIDVDDWSAWLGGTDSKARNLYRNGSDLYEVSIEYVRITPSEFNLKVPARNTPQVWKRIWVNHSVLIYCERMTNAHEKIPVFFFQPSEEGLGYQSKSLAEDAKPFQQLSSSLMNSVLAARRRAVGDRMIYDPSRISEAHINNPSPTGKIPVRPSAYGKNVAESVYQIPFRDDQSSIALQEIQQLVQFANVLNGMNSVRQGQFVKGNKTDSQWEDSMTAATSKDQRTALLAEALVFTPLKEVLKFNYLQYQQAGSVYSPNNQQGVSIDPIALRQAVLNFKVTDGLLPKEKVIKSDTMKVGLQAIATSPQLAQGYNIGPMFSYLMKIENVDFTPFEKSQPQLAYEQALGTWNQVAMAAAQKGLEISTPMPKPQDFGYDPNANDPAARQQQPGDAQGQQ